MNQAPIEPVAQKNLADVLDRETVEGTLWAPDNGKVRCLACGHRCLIGEGRRGVCKVRFNRNGRLRVPFGYVAGVQCDPVEKKPFFHVLPGTNALTFGMLGCDLHCGYCQNWVTSQALRDPESSVRFSRTTPSILTQTAGKHRARLVVSSYNEPLITAEWGAAVFASAREAGYLCAMVSNGNGTPEALDFLRPHLSAMKIDLKGFDDSRYRRLGGTLGAVRETIRSVHERGLWLEVVTLLVPGFNDAPGELDALASFLASVSPDIPWHVTAFHPDYRMTDPRATMPDDLVRACELGKSAGLRFVYAGNRPGLVGEWEDTRCPNCARTLVKRRGYRILANSLTAKGCCPGCGQYIPGVWMFGSEAEHARADTCLTC